MLAIHYIRIGIVGGFALLLAPTAMAEGKVELDPGLYQFNHVVKAGPQLLHTNDYQYCIFEDNNSRTLSELVEDLAGGGDCSVSNVTFGGGQGSADVTCRDTEFGFDISGSLSANYTRTKYDVTTVAQLPMGGGTMTVLTHVNRLKACPADWTLPEGISPD